MEMPPDTLKEVLGELFALLETQETNSTAVLQLLKDQGIASDEKLSTYLDQAGRASNVKWRAARMRMEYLLTPIQKETADNNKTKEPAKNAPNEEEKEQIETKASEKTEKAKTENAKTENRPDQDTSHGDAIPETENTSANQTASEQAASKQNA